MSLEGRASGSLSPGVPTSERIRTNLPAPTSRLYGREDELAVLFELIATARLVTLSGPGGSGKTRLALEVARHAAEDFDAVWFVALEHLPDPNDVAGAMARVMGLPELPGVDSAERVLDHLRARSVLLVLDNFEHLVDAGAFIGQVARAGPDVRVLVTSQLPLRVGGENVLSLDPLPVPTGSERELAVLREVPAVQLLLDRAAQAGGGFTLTEANRFDIVRVCRELEGMPLALELAAPRLPGRDPGEIVQSLETASRSAADTPARERGVRAALEWSVGLLSDEQRTLLGRLAVFAAGFTGQLAGAAFAETAGALPALVAAGLVHRGEGPRFQIRPAVRAFAAELLDAEAEDVAHGAIADALTARAEPYEKRWPALVGEGRHAIALEEGNIVAELDWAQLMDYGRHARLAASTGWWMSLSGAAEFSRDHLEIALARSTDPALRARCLQALGALGLHDSDPSGCLDAADAWHDLGDAEGEFYCAIYGAHLYGHAQEGEAQIELVQRCAELAAALPSDPDVPWLLATEQALALSLLGLPHEGLEPLPALLAGAAPGSWQQFSIAARLGDLELVLHRAERALDHYGAALAAVAALGMPVEALLQATMIAAALLALGRSEDAAATWAICELGYDELSWSPPGAARDWYDAVRADLSAEALAGGRRQAAQLGTTRGLAWVAGLARGDG